MLWSICLVLIAMLCGCSMINGRKIECENNQVMLPNVLTTEDTQNVDRFGCVNVTIDHENNTQMACDCGWFKSCKHHFKNNINDTVYVAGIEYSEKIVYFKCCWSSLFHYDYENCVRAANDSKVLPYLNDNSSVTIVASIFQSKYIHKIVGLEFYSPSIYQHVLIMCIAAAKNDSFCSYHHTDEDKSEWVRALIIGIVIPLAIECGDQYDECVAGWDICCSDSVNVGTNEGICSTAGDQVDRCGVGAVADPCSTEGAASECAAGLQCTSGTCQQPVVECSLNQHDTCVSGVDMCCTGSTNLGFNEGSCIVANDGVNRCSVGGKGDDCTTDGSLAECTAGLACTAGTCKTECIVTRNQYDICTAAAGLCCTGSTNVGSNESSCVAANDGINRCSVGGKGDGCTTPRSSTECTTGLVCSAGTCQKTCPAITPAQGTLIAYVPANLTPDGGYAPGTTATYNCPHPNEEAIYPDPVTCSAGIVPDFVVNYATVPICCTKQYSFCLLTSCCTTNPNIVSAANIGACVTASDMAER